MHDPGTGKRHAAQGRRDQFGRGQVVRADQVIARRGRIRQRTQQVEHRAHGERRAYRRERLHRRMIIRREQEREAVGLEAARRGLLVERKLQAQLFDQVGAAAAAGDRAVAVLDDRHAAGGGQQRRTGREIQAPGGISSGADEIDRIESRREARLARERSHRARKAAHLGRRDPLGPQGGEQSAGERRMPLAPGQPSHQLAGVLLRQVIAAEQALEGLLRGFQVRFLRASGNCPSGSAHRASIRSLGEIARPRSAVRYGARP